MSKEKRKFKDVLKRGDKQSKDTPYETGKVPRITNETVIEHREEVLSRARKYIYPLQHSKHRIVVVSTALFIAVVIILFTYTTLALYRFQTSSAFLYSVTQVIPFPIAKADGNFVSYENYLFELRRYTHYYDTQQNLDSGIGTGATQAPIEEFKRRALDKVINDAYIQKLAKQQGITVSDDEVEHQINIARDQNRLGGSDQVFEDVLKEYWDWSISDFKRSLKQQLLAQKVAAALDVDTQKRAADALQALANGTEFAEVAKLYSDDEPTKASGGEFGFVIDKTSRDLSTQTTETLFSLEPGQVSGIINSGYSLEILKNIENKDDKIRGAHILFNFKDISIYVNDLKEQSNSQVYITIPEQEAQDLPLQ